MSLAIVKQEDLTEYLASAIPCISQITEVKCPVCTSKLTNIATQLVSEGIGSIVLTFACGQHITYSPSTKKYDMNVTCRYAVAIVMNQKMDSYKNKTDNRFEGIK